MTDFDLDNYIHVARKITVQRREKEAEYLELAQKAADLESDYELTEAKAFLVARDDGCPVEEAKQRARVAGAAERRAWRQAAVLARSALQRVDGLDGERSLVRGIVDRALREGA